MSESATLLVVDDDEINLDILNEFLSDEGYHILKASDGLEAKEVLQTPPATLKVVVLDWMMPQINGIELLSWIKNEPAVKHIPVIMQTAKGYKDDVVEGLDKGACQYLAKPFDKEVLCSMVRSAIEEFDRFQATKQGAASQVAAVRQYAVKVIEKNNQKIEHLQLDLQTQQLINQFFVKSLSCQSLEELTHTLLETGKKLEFDSSEGRSLRCSVHLGGETEVAVSDRGMNSQVDKLILKQALSGGKIIQGGSYTALASNQQRVALMIRNTPQDSKECDKALEIISMLLDQFEQRLLHFESELKLREKNEELDKKNQQIQQIVFSCYQELDHINESYQQMKDQQMEILENLAESLFLHLPQLEGSQKQKVRDLIDAQLLKSIEFYSADHITDQKFLITLGKLKEIFEETLSESQEKLEPGQMSEASQGDVDDLLASLGL